MGVCNCSMFCCTLLYVHSSIAIIAIACEEERAGCFAIFFLPGVSVEWLFLAVPWGCLRFVIVVFPDHTHLLFSVHLRMRPVDQANPKTLFPSSSAVTYWQIELQEGPVAGRQAPDKSAYLNIIFLISPPKHMLWVLKRTVSMRRFF